MTWSDPYIGLSYRDRGRDRAGVDCWGLVRLAYADVFGVDLPEYSNAYVSAVESREVAQIIDGEEQLDNWTRIEKPKPLDLMVFRHGRFRSHVGLFVMSGLMLHIAEGHSSRIESYVAGHWRPRLTGIYRYSGARHE